MASVSRTAFLKFQPSTCRQQVQVVQARGLPSKMPFGLQRLVAAAAPAARRLQAPLSVRCLATKGGSDKSWTEIAAEAGQLATDLAKKVGDTVGKAVSAIVPSEEKAEPRQPLRRESGRRQQGDVFRPEDLGLGGGGLVGGLLGRAVGGMLRSAVGALGEQLREAQQQAADIQERAARMIENSSKLREQMGGSVQVMPPVSQSSMSSSVNGRSAKTVTLLMPVVGASGRTAQAQVQFTEGTGTASEKLSVIVRLPNGGVLNLDSDNSLTTQTIDVEWRSVDDK